MKFPKSLKWNKTVSRVNVIFELFDQKHFLDTTARLFVQNLSIIFEVMLWLKLSCVT